MRHRLIVPGAVAASLLLAVPASAAEPAPGAPGVGDPYYPDYGNGGYDVSHYDLRLKYQPKSDALEGTATLLTTATQDLSRFNLDFALDVTEVRVGGKKAKFTTSGAHELEITPAKSLAKGERATVVVRYQGTPSKVEVNGFTSWLRTPDGGVAANEPEAAWWWFPSNDHPTDKAGYDVSVAVPDGTQAISNGTLQSQSSRAGWTRYNWRSRAPQATYLATLAVGKFDITQDKTDSGLPVINAYSKDLGEHAGAARASVERTGELTGWLEKYFGKYPFDAVGGYVPNTDTTYALETQTRPFYSPDDFSDGSNTSVVVHELAHQWYGDSVSLKGWKDIWINEGFARYSQWLWSEDQGEGTAQELADYAYASHPADDAFWKVEPGDPGAANQFHSAVYDRGAMAVQALRNKVGDKDFFAILKGWPKQHAGGNADVGDFVAYAEEVSGTSLNSLFDTWLYEPSKPDASAAGASADAAPNKPSSWKQIHSVDHPVTESR
ncbi:MULTISPECIES: M1 family metallopeptidase [unclassified Streptomyces]|uniref:M1 family metallopeptidase n=1 Tax=unclassified Streptomyces TaxID=2593676 RepID=UPI002DD9D51D|nr:MULTISPECIES: M1 family metallopeptidase [unclassified Streptomyces]WSB75426.1 M1 family metallopeptidase [Streptomyces sp. NBC_01775]WSS16291.1 M1 family metallopeptidase [Streptomyces sp. NBC_01186]WSS45109.1 M1 family metallopeptidase [Streptomyces sp. NBC_01187]